MFDERREQHEDAELLVALVGTGALQFVPEQYHRDPLRCFLWIAQTRPELLARGDWKRGACAARRRAWCTHWNPEDLVRSGFRQRAARCQAPKAALELLAPLAREVLGAPVRGLHREEAQLPRWALRDTTVVRYKPEESQVPHIDTSDVTMLLYLSDAGGRTCFPHLGCSVQPRRGRVLVFCSTQPRAARFGGFAGSAYGEPLDSTMHYGSLMEEPHGEKMILQLLFAAEDQCLPFRSWAEALQGDALRQAARTYGCQAQPLPRPGRPGRGVGLCLAKERCASGCKDLAIDLSLEPKLCIHCW
ncbi:unnamed protein product, partial [Effrenium voratum]